MPVGQDKYSNIIYDQVTESAANTLTFKELEFGVSLFDKVGILIHRIEYWQFYALLQAAADGIAFGLSTSNSWSAADPSEKSIIQYEHFSITDYGTAGNNHIWELPLIRDFSEMPGGGVLATPKPMYLFTEGSNLGSASLVKMRMFFTIIKLKPEEYFELLETRHYFG